MACTSRQAMGRAGVQKPSRYGHRIRSNDLLGWCLGHFALVPCDSVRKLLLLTPVLFLPELIWETLAARRALASNRAVHSPPTSQLLLIRLCMRSGNRDAWCGLSLLFVLPSRLLLLLLLLLLCRPTLHPDLCIVQELAILTLRAVREVIDNLCLHRASKCKHLEWWSCVITSCTFWLPRHSGDEHMICYLDLIFQLVNAPIYLFNQMRITIVVVVQAQLHAVLFPANRRAMYLEPQHAHPRFSNKSTLNQTMLTVFNVAAEDI
mmetsp:Transcript_91947/g.238254  ORF Transcript_91947/g.238254 Transcript_91947/m.238254 type:complete len:264 (+) Transcript_91947:981-1772(+)